MAQSQFREADKKNSLAFQWSSQRNSKLESPAGRYQSDMEELLGELLGPFPSLFLSFLFPRWFMALKMWSRVIHKAKKKKKRDYFLGDRRWVMVLCGYQCLFLNLAQPKGDSEIPGQTQGRRKKEVGKPRFYSFLPPGESLYFPSTHQMFHTAISVC